MNKLTERSKVKKQQQLPRIIHVTSLDYNQWWNISTCTEVLVIYLSICNCCYFIFPLHYMLGANIVLYSPLHDNFSEATLQIACCVGAKVAHFKIIKKNKRILIIDKMLNMRSNNRPNNRLSPSLQYRGEVPPLPVDHQEKNPYSNEWRKTNHF